MKWQGIWVAIVTPFRGGEIDREALNRQVDRMLAAGVYGLCPCGTTGEGAAFDDGEFRTVVETVLERVKGKIPVVAGTGSNNTDATVERTKMAKSIGADGALVVTPYYVKPTQEGLYRHYAEIAKIEFPMMLYNVPGRTAVNMLPSTVERLTELPAIRAIKDCAPLPQIAELRTRVKDRISILSGEDGVSLPFLAMGGDGVVSVAGNVVPEKMVKMYRHVVEGRLAEARKEYLDLTRLIQLLFVESNPIPVKKALELMGIMSGELRLPLAPMKEENAKLLHEELNHLNLG